MVEAICNERLEDWFGQHPQETRKVVQKVVEAAIASSTARSWVAVG